MRIHNKSILLMHMHIESCFHMVFKNGTFGSICNSVVFCGTDVSLKFSNVFLEIRCKFSFLFSILNIEFIIYYFSFSSNKWKGGNKFRCICSDELLNDIGFHGSWFLSSCYMLFDVSLN